MRYSPVLILSILLFSCAASAVFENYKNALVSAPNIVYGTVIDKVDLYETYTPYRTNYIFRIEETIKGTTQSDTINLLGISGKTSSGSFVDRTSDCQFKVGDQRILMMDPIKEKTDSLSIYPAEVFGDKSKVDFSILDQYYVRKRIVFENGKSKYTKPKVSPSKMIKLINEYLNDPNKVVPKERMRID